MGSDFADLLTPVYLGPRIERYLGDSWCMHLPCLRFNAGAGPEGIFVSGVKQGESYFAFCQSAAENKISVRVMGLTHGAEMCQTGNLDPEIEHEGAGITGDIQASRSSR